eukprot:3733224-Alexandrium_andersonii.AAC.1
MQGLCKHNGSTPGAHMCDKSGASGLSAYCKRLKQGRAPSTWLQHPLQREVQEPGLVRSATGAKRGLHLR